MLKPSIQLRVGQHLAMTPQLQQAIRLLQLSTLDLQAEIQQTFEQNPMLERVEEVQDGATTEANGTDLLETVTGDNGTDEVPVETNWEDLYDTGPSYGRDSDYDPLENQSSESEGLRGHLYWQLGLTHLTDTDRTIATAIIDAIDDDGYLGESLEAIHANLSDELDIELDEVEAVLHLVQQFDPVGVGARSLSECLGVQLTQLAPDFAGLEAARLIVEQHLDLLAGRNMKQLARLTSLGEDALAETVDLIQSLNPKPGAQISDRRPEYLIPDVSVYKSAGAWHVELNPDIAPRLRINQLYAGMIKRADRSEDNVYLRNQLQEARWFIKSLQSRNETLLKVAVAIVDRQRGFLEYGEEAMKPLVLKDIAEQLDMHESTISRVTTQKYMHTPRGILEFKYFFSSHVGTADGGMCSATAIRAMIRSLVAKEDRGKPLSDSKIASILGSKGINVARRTVAKYREAMSIPPSNERKNPA